MDRVLGEVSIEELKNLARENGGVIKYWLMSSGGVSHRFLNEKGRFCWDKDGEYITPGGSSIKRFVNYWHAYAYMLRLTKK